MADEHEEIVEKQIEVEVPDVEVEAPVVEETEQEVEEEVDWKSEAEKARELANNQRIRAEKAERKLKDAPPLQQQSDALSSKDVIYMAKADIHPDDVDEVLETAKSKKWDVRKAHDYLKPILEKRAEERTTASAANVQNVRRGPAKVTDDVLVANAAKGKLPEDDEGIERLIAAKARQR